MTRTCAHGACGASLEGRRPNVRYCTDACKTAEYRRRRSYVAQTAGKPSQPRFVSRPRTPRPSDLRVTWTQLVEKLGERAALEVLTPAQRERLRR